MLRSFLTSLVIIFAFQTSAVELNGTWIQEAAYMTKESQLQKFESTIQPELFWTTDNDLAWTFIPRLRFDTEGMISPNESRVDSYASYNGPFYNTGYAELGLRELYVDFEAKGAYWRLGKQQVVWGQTDGIKLLDVINPQSFREFILEEFDDSRIPLWMINVEIPFGENTLQLLWIPDTTYNELPEFDSPYSFTSPRNIPQAPTSVPVELNDTDKPSRFFGDSDLGARFTAFIDGWDLSVNYLYHYEDFPILFQQLTADGVIISPEYKRNHLFGGTLSNAFGDFTLRTEVAYKTNTFHLTDNIFTSGIHDSPEFSSAIGLDYQGISDTFLSMQWFQSLITDYDDAIIREEHENTITFLAEVNLYNETWEIELLVGQSIDHSDGFLQPKITHTYLSNVDIWLGIDIFYGTKQGLFGQFSETNRVTLGFEYGF